VVVVVVTGAVAAATGEAAGAAIGNLARSPHSK
jgi:hypothetical protein